MAKKLDRAQQAEKSAYLIAATTFVSAGVVMIEKNLWAGAILVVLGAALFVIRELRKK